MNNKLILVKYASEIFLKGLNRGKFERKLKENIEKKLSGLEFEFVTDQGRGFIKATDIEAAVERVRKVFGVAEVCIVTQVERDLNAIKEEALNKVKEANPKTFKIETNRANKKFQLNSIETSRQVGGYVLHHFGEALYVDVKNPECLVNIEIRENAYVFTSKDKIKGVGGLPYGMNGSTMLMLSGGIDSPVAGYLMARRGVELNCVYYHSHPYTSERAKDKVKELANSSPKRFLKYSYSLFSKRAFLNSLLEIISIILSFNSSFLAFSLILATLIEYMSFSLTIFDTSSPIDLVILGDPNLLLILNPRFS